MEQKPQLVLRVNDVKESAQFYTQHLGWKIAWEQPEKNIFCLYNKEDQPVAILTSDQTLDVKHLLDTAYMDPHPGQRIYMVEEGLNNKRKRLQEKEVQGIEFIIDEGFGQTLLIPDPNGYVIALWEELYMPDEEIVELYRKGPTMLEESLYGLSEEDLDLVRKEGKWSIRQTVFHLIDSDITTLQKVKYALAEPSRSYLGNAYDPDIWEKETLYSNRRITTTVPLFRYLREHILELCECLPDALDRSVLVERTGEHEEVRKMIKMVGGHAKGHIEQIWETRRINEI